MSPETPALPPPRLGRGARWAITAGIAAVCWLAGLVLLMAASISEAAYTDPGEDPGSRFGQPLFVAAGVVLALGVVAIVVGAVVGLRTPRQPRD
jgi:Na+(H+)/acetate symporter ActP